MIRRALLAALPVALLAAATPPAHAQPFPSKPDLDTADIGAAAKVELAHVPYEGDAPMLQDPIGRRPGFGAMLAGSIGPQLQAGRLRLRAV